MSDTDGQYEVRVKEDDISKGKLCPFMMTVNSGTFTRDSKKSTCVGEMCALFQSFDYPVPLMDDDGKPVKEIVKDGDGNEREGIKIDYIHRLQGCSLVLGTTFQNQASAACGKMEQYGAHLLRQFQTMALARKAGSESGLMLPPHAASRPAR